MLHLTSRPRFIIAVMRKRITVLHLVLFSAAVLFAAEAKLETLPAFSGEGVPPAVAKALEPQGYRVVLPDSVCELWFRSGLVSSENKGAGGDVLYPQLASSTFLGVIRVAKGLSDFRGQPIKPGTYSLRYELLPEDGNHLGVSPNRDFLLLVPASADPNPNAAMGPEDLAKLSNRASGTNHPALLSLTSADQSAFPSVSANAEGFTVLSVKLKMSAGELPMAVIVKGTAPQ